MNRSQDHRFEELRWCEELVEQLTMAYQEVADAWAKAIVDIDAFEQLRGEWDRLVATVDELHGELEVIDQEHSLRCAYLRSGRSRRGPLKGIS
jgi:hypothetical protein